MGETIEGAEIRKHGLRVPRVSMNGVITLNNGVLDVFFIGHGDSQVPLFRGLLQRRGTGPHLHHM